MIPPHLPANPWQLRRTGALARDPAIDCCEVCSARNNAILWQNQHDPSMKHIFSSVMLIGLLAAAAETFGQSTPVGNALRDESRNSAVGNALRGVPAARS